MLYNSTTTLYRNLITLIYHIKQLLGAVDGQRSFTWERKTNYYNTITDIYIQKTNFLSFLGFPVSYIMTKINGVIQYKHPFWDLVISFPNNITISTTCKTLSFILSVGPRTDDDNLFTKLDDFVLESICVASHCCKIICLIKFYNPDSTQKLEAFPVSQSCYDEEIVTLLQGMRQMPWINHPFLIFQKAANVLGFKEEGHSQTYYS